LQSEMLFCWAADWEAEYCDASCDSFWFFSCRYWLYFWFCPAAAAPIFYRD
jgi:hypothetical protein